MRVSGRFGMSMMATALAFTAFGCSPASKTSGSSSSAAGSGTAGSGSGSGDATDTGSAGSIATPSSTATLANMTADNYPDGFYTGYDGGASTFALLLPGFRKYTLADSSVARIDEVAVTVSQTTLNSLIAAVQGINPNLTTAQITKQFSRQQTMYLLTPLKAGNTTMSAVSNFTGMSSGTHTGAPIGGGAVGGGGAKGGIAAGDPWTKGSSLTLLVTQYSAAQITEGQARYTNNFDTADPACASCHLTGKDGAPPHALGDINDIPDVAAEQWVTTGKLGTRVATIPHAWKFSDMNQEISTVAYVRSLETNDPEQLIELQFAQQFGLTLNSNGTFSAATSSGSGT